MNKNICLLVFASLLVFTLANPIDSLEESHPTVMANR